MRRLLLFLFLSAALFAQGGPGGSGSPAVLLRGTISAGGAGAYLKVLNPPTGGTGITFNIPVTSLTSNNTSACSGVSTPSLGCAAAFTGLSDHCGQSDTSGGPNNGSCTVPGGHAYPGAPGPPTTPISTNVQQATTVPAPANINIGDMRALAYSGFSSTGHAVCHYQPWWVPQSVSHNHIANVQMDERNSDTVRSQAQNMITRGCEFVTFDWYGQSSIENTVTTAWRDYLDTCNCNLKMAVMEDAGTQSGATEGGFENDLTYLYTNYMRNHASYWKLSDRNGCTNRPVLLSFGFDGGSFNSGNWGDIKAWIHSTLNGGVSCNNEPILISEGENGLSDTNQDGAYLWIGVNNYDNSSPGTPTVQGISGTGQFNVHFASGSFNASSWYTAANTNSSRWILAIGDAYAGFNDSNADWGFRVSSPQARKLATQCGQVWVQSWAQLPSNSPVKYMGVTVWNDYEEGTAMEPGIDNCYNAPSLSLSGSNLTVTLTKADATFANLITIQNEELYVSIDGINAALLATLSPANVQTVNLTSYSSLVVGTTYKVYVRLVGKPGIQNKTSSFVTYIR